MPEHIDATQDYRAAMDEIHGNVEIRRLMFVFIHVLLPGGVMAAADCLTGVNLPATLAWWPRAVLPILGLLIALSGVVVCIVLSRCHFGLVVNSMKMQSVAKGVMNTRALNWRGVTTSFVVLTGLSASAGLVFFLATFTPVAVALVLGVGALVFSMLMLLSNHARANALAQRLQPNWHHGEVPPALVEEHIGTSLADSNADIAIVVTMAAAVFIGMFSAMAQLGGIEPDLGVHARLLELWSMPAFAGFLTVSLMLSGRMVVRLRVAIAEHSQALAVLRSEPDDPWRFNPAERTFLLFILVELLVCFSVAILVNQFATPWLATGTGALVMAGGILGYYLALRSGRRRRAEQPAGENPEQAARIADAAPIE